MKEGTGISKSVRLALVSLVVCGLVLPLVMTGIGQVAMPWQANGSQVYCDGKSIGSELIAQNFSSPVFFHPRNNSASGVDPDITLKDAMSQLPGIHSATGISISILQSTLIKFRQYTLFFFGQAYANVVTVNLYLVKSFPAVYGSFVK